MDDRAAELIERIGAAYRAERRAAAAAAGLSLAQLDALQYLASCNRFSDTPAAVAEYADATRGTTSQTIRALERKGLVVRTGDAKDGRVSHLAPTADGARVLDASGVDRIGAAIRGLGPDRERLESLLERVLGDAQRARGGRMFGRCAGCRHLRGRAGGHRCGLTDEPLSDRETTLLCAEHEAA